MQLYRRGLARQIVVSEVRVIRGNLSDPLVMRVDMPRVWNGELGEPIPLTGRRTPCPWRSTEWE